MTFFPVSRAQIATPQSVTAEEMERRRAAETLRPMIATPPQPVSHVEEDVPSLPSMTQMAKNVTASLARTVKAAARGQSVRLSKEEADRRLAICQTCQFFRTVDQRCSKCGCFMAVKTYLRAETCPVGKW